MNLDSARSILVEHSQSKKNGVFPLDFNHEAKLTNPVCGDHVELKLLVIENIIQNIGHKAEACAICSASASLLAEKMKGKDVDAVLKMGELFQQSIMEAQTLPWPQALNEIVCFEHLRVNPARRMCALLPWVVLKNAMKRNV